MKRIFRLTESDLVKLVRRTINELGGMNRDKYRVLLEYLIDYIGDENLSMKILNKIMNTDPTVDGKYTDWIVFQFIKSEDKNDFVNDLILIKEILRTYNRSEKNKQINHFKSIDELKNWYNNFSDKKGFWFV
jgi:hypothetical protein